jgi:hypothetical protein
MNKQERLQHAFHLYQEAHGGVPHGTDVVVAWAVKHGILELPDIDPSAVLAEAMAQALRTEYGTDPVTGRRYRKNHAVRITRRGVQFALWAEMETAPREHMLAAFQQRRKQIVGDCVQLKADVDVYNSRNHDQEPIQMILDFTKDVAEAEAADDIDEAAE